MGIVAGVSFFAAGVVVALNPNTVPGYHIGAFGGPVQFLSVVAIGAVLCTVVVDGHEQSAEVHGASGDDVGA